MDIETKKENKNKKQEKLFRKSTNPGAGFGKH